MNTRLPFLQNLFALVIRSMPIIVFVGYFHMSNASVAQDVPSYIRLFEGICVGTRFSEDGFETAVSLIDGAFRFTDEEM